MMRKKAYFLICTLSACALMPHLYADEPSTISNFKTHLIAPLYPPSELLLHRNGTADITCHLLENGLADSCQIDQATSPAFGQSSLYAAVNSIMLPNFEDNHPVPTIRHQHYVFQKHWPAATSPVIDTSHPYRPSYPPAAEEAHLSGTVKVSCTIDPIGIAHDCEATGGPEILRQTALGYFTTARYIPALQDGNPITHSYSGSMTWSNEDNSADPFKSH
ncbi:energy transducer TonB [Neokomagataea anthophila]|uniref:Energy transducer TonB n=1 Tax=Neokomagataea anthophila TaxID=2826925 RepID=A0ABS5E559_9PROT|nr:energy transducer TonB [Neokomagataea anthophila]MBR0559038.1 energy transducer TonB [Neokomagataea anthophila]